MADDGAHLKGVWRQAEDIVARDIAGEAILVPVHGDLADMQRIFALDPVPRFIWDALDGRVTLDAVCAALVREFDVDRQVAEADLLEFVGELAAAGLIEAGGAQGGLSAN